MSMVATASAVSGRIVGRAGVGLTAIALCLAGAFLTNAHSDYDASSGATRVTLGVLWFLGTVAAAAVLTSGASRFTRAIDMRRGTLFYFLLSFGILSLAWRHQLGGSSEIVNIGSIPKALLVAQAAVAAWGIGFRFLPMTLLRSFMIVARSIAAPSGPWRLRSPYVPILLYLASVASTLYQLRTGSFAYLADGRALIATPGSFGPLLELGEGLGQAGVVVAAVGVLTAKRDRLRATLIFIVLIGAEVGTGAFSGTKAPFILLAVSVAVPLFATRRSISWKLVLASLAVLAVGTAFNGTYRDKLNEPGGRQRALDAFSATAAETLQPIALTNSVIDGVESLGIRLRQIDNIAIVVQRTPSEIPYRGTGNLLLDPVRSVVPRALWPTKPVVTTGLDFTREYYNSSTFSSSAVTVVGDLYRHGGIVVVIIGMLLLGGAVRLADDYWHPFRDIRFAVLYAAFFLTLVNLESDVASVITSLPIALLSGLLASRLAFAPANGEP